MSNTKTKNFVVYSLKLANSLIKKGFEIKGSGINIQNPKYTVYFFEDTEQLRAAVNEFKKI